MLEMKTSCLVCEVTLAHDDSAAICSHECTYCLACASESNHTCKNCGGELVQDPSERSLMLVVARLKPMDAVCQNFCQ